MRRRRLQALAHVHDILFASTWTRASLTVIIDGILAPYVQSTSGRVRARGPDMNIGAKPGTLLLLCMNSRPMLQNTAPCRTIIGHEAAVTAHSLCDALLIDGDDLAQVLGAHTDGECRRADQVGELTVT